MDRKANCASEDDPAPMHIQTELSGLIGEGETRRKGERENMYMKPGAGNDGGRGVPI